MQSGHDFIALRQEQQANSLTAAKLYLHGPTTNHFRTRLIWFKSTDTGSTLSSGFEKDQSVIGQHPAIMATLPPLAVIIQRISHEKQGQRQHPHKCAEGETDGGQQHGSHQCQRKQFTQKYAKDWLPLLLQGLVALEQRFRSWADPVAGRASDHRQRAHQEFFSKPMAVARGLPFSLGLMVVANRMFLGGSILKFKLGVAFDWVRA